MSNNEMYEVKILPRGQKDLDPFRGKLFDRIKAKVLSLRDNPRPPGCEKLTEEDGYRVRVGNYRVLYRISDKTKKVFVYRVRHRREVYR